MVPHMAQITLGGNPINTNGELPAAGATAPDFTLTKADWTPVSAGDLAGQRVVMNIFPSLDTGLCQTTVRTFNERAADLENTAVLCVSADLPPAAARFCGAEGIENVITGSTFKNPEVLEALGVKMLDGKLRASPLVPWSCSTPTARCCTANSSRNRVRARLRRSDRRLG